MRDIATIDSELRLLSRAWRAARLFSEQQLSEQTPTTQLIDQLLDERTATVECQG